MGSHLSTCAPKGDEYYHCDYSIAGFRDNTSTVADDILGFTSVALQEELQSLQPDPDVAGVGVSRYNPFFFLLLLLNHSPFYLFGAIFGLLSCCSLLSSDPPFDLQLLNVYFM